jgi:Caudovirus prohead serine protease
MPNGNLKYEMQDGETGGNRRIIDAANMIHVPLMSFDGIVGLSPIMQAAPALGLAAATEKFGSRLFTNYATPMRQTWELLWSVAIYRGCSFGFRTNKDSWKNENGVLIRTLEAIEVMELSLTAQPAYTQTSTFVRSCPHGLRKLLARSMDDNDDDDECDCDCDECLAGDCLDCDDPDCDDPNCDHGETPHALSIC